MTEVVHNYTKIIKGEDVDVYDVLDAFNCGCSAAEHAVKKLLNAGDRGVKSRVQDLREAQASIARAIQNELEKM